MHTVVWLFQGRIADRVPKAVNLFGFFLKQPFHEQNIDGVSESVQSGNTSRCYRKDTFFVIFRPHIL